MDKLDDLKGRLTLLKEQYTENDRNVKKAEQEANSAEELANRAEQVCLYSLCPCKYKILSFGLF